MDKSSGRLKLITDRIGRISDAYDRLVENLRQMAAPFEAEVMGFLLALAQAFAVVYCLVTAHDIPAAGGGVFFGCAFISAVAAAFFLARDLLGENEDRKLYRIALTAAGVAVPVIIGWLARKKIADSALLALPVIAHNYGLTLEMAEDKLFLPETATLFLLSVAVIPIITTVWTVVRARSPLVAAAGSVPFFALSIVSFAQLPAPWAVCLYILALGLVVLSARSRSHSDESGFRHIFRAAPALALLIIAVALFIDPSEYKTPDWLQKLQNRTYTVVNSVIEGDSGNEFNYVDTTGITTGDSIDLSELSSQEKLGIKVMSVRLSNNDFCYLRSMSYAGYMNNEWYALPERSAELINRLIESPLTEQFWDVDSAHSIIIKTDTVHPYIFTPYYTGAAPSGSVPYGDAAIKNGGELTIYNISFGGFPSRDTYLNEYSIEGDAVYSYRELVESYYLNIPSGTADALFSLAVENGIISQEIADVGGVPIDNQTYAADVVSRVAEFVRGCAVYSLDPEPMPEGVDFPVWFLTEAESGYCTHFASSGALLLRAIGIPARLTTGYYSAASQDEWRLVTTDDAHAWVEYYLPHSGWQLLEVTGRYADNETAGGSENDPVTSTAESSTTTTQTTTASSDTQPTGGTTTSPHNASGSDAPDNPASLSPSDSGDDGKQSEGEKGKSGNSGRFLLVILLIAAVPAAVYGGLYCARWFVLRKRYERFDTGTSNQRVIAMWDNIVRLTAALKKTPPGKIEAIMLKARFSQHIISEQELSMVSSCMENLIERLESNPDSMSRFVHKYIMFLY